MGLRDPEYGPETDLHVPWKLLLQNFAPSQPPAADGVNLFGRRVRSLGDFRKPDPTDSRRKPHGSSLSSCGSAAERMSQNGGQCSYITLCGNMVRLLCPVPNIEYSLTMEPSMSKHLGDTDLLLRCLSSPSHHYAYSQHQFNQGTFEWPEMAR